MRDQKYILDVDGQTPIQADLLTWARWFEQHELRIVCTTPTPDGKVSTVFVGLDHSFGEGDPVLWETMVFGGPLDGEQERYTSYADAVAGHEQMVKRVERSL